MLVKEYINIKTTDEKYKCSALFFAIMMGHGGFQEIITLLVKNGADLESIDA